MAEADLPITAVEAHDLLNALCAIHGLLITADEMVDRDAPDRGVLLHDLIGAARIRSIEAIDELRLVIVRPLPRPLTPRH